MYVIEEAKNAYEDADEKSDDIEKDHVQVLRAFVNMASLFAEVEVDFLIQMKKSNTQNSYGDPKQVIAENDILEPCRFVDIDGCRKGRDGDEKDEE